LNIKHRTLNDFTLYDLRFMVLFCSQLYALSSKLVKFLNPSIPTFAILKSEIPLLRDTSKSCRVVSLNKFFYRRTKMIEI